MGIKTGNFIEHSLAEAVSFLKNSVFMEEYASRSGFLQARAPRIKIFAVTLLLLAALFTKSITFLLGLYILCLIVAQSSSINLGFFLKRTWIFIPVFSLIIAVPALFAAFTPGEPIFTFKMFNIVFVITKQGIAGASIFFMRVLTFSIMGGAFGIDNETLRSLKGAEEFWCPADLRNDAGNVLPVYLSSNRHISGYLHRHTKPHRRHFFFSRQSKHHGMEYSKSMAAFV